MNYHIGRLVLSLLCVGDLVRLVFGGVRFAGLFTCQRYKQLLSFILICEDIINAEVYTA
jgi:hypothetical protein